MNKVPFTHIQKLVSELTFVYTQVQGTTKTICTAVLPNGFMVGSGESSCVLPSEFDFEVGCKYAKERALQDATNELWKLEGYVLKVTGGVSGNESH